MNDNIDKILNMENLEDLDLEQVSGGNSNSISDRKNKRIKHCKYCNKNTLQIFKGEGQGWSKNGKLWPCKLWECTVCKNTNYWRAPAGREIDII